MMNSKSLKNNLPVILCFALTVLLLLSVLFYFKPLYNEEITVENALYVKWAGFSALVLWSLLCPKHFRVVFLAILMACVLNATALAVNDGYMPVASSSCIYVEGHHIPMYEGVRLPFLCDWIFGVMSIGDLFLWLSAPLAIIIARRSRRSPNET